MIIDELLQLCNSKKPTDWYSKIKIEDTMIKVYSPIDQYTGKHYAFINFYEFFPGNNTMVLKSVYLRYTLYDENILVSYLNENNKIIEIDIPYDVTEEWLFQQSTIHVLHGFDLSRASTLYEIKEKYKEFAYDY